MVVQFELGSKHLEDKKQANIAISEITATSPKEIVKELNNKSYGQIPSEKTAYNDYLGLAISIEEIAKIAPEVASMLVDQIVAKELVNKYGTDSGRNLINSNEVYAILCAEPGNADLKNLTTKVTKSGNNWHIQGKKLIRSEHLIADKYLVYALDEEGKTRVFAIPGQNIQISQIQKSIAGKNINLNQTELDIDVSESSNIAVINDSMERILSIGRTLVAAVAVGLGHSTISTSITGAKEVKGADNAAISGTQSMQFALADMYGELEAGRSLTYYSADLIDSNKSSIKYATMAKVQATDAAANNSLQALQILGNLGYLANNDFSDLIRVAVDGQTKGGTNRIQRNHIYQYMLDRK